MLHHAACVYVYRYWVIVRREPSTTTALGTWFDSDRASSNWPPYPTLEMCFDQTTSSSIPCQTASIPGNRVSACVCVCGCVGVFHAIYNHAI